MAKSKVSRSKTAPKAPAKKPATPSESAKPPAPSSVEAAIDEAIDNEIRAQKEKTKASYAKSGIPFVDYPRDDALRAHQRAMRLEELALASREDDSLRSRLMRVLGAGMFVHEPADAERALLRYAAATTKATALALLGAELVRSNEAFEVEFTDQDAATIMCGLSELLEVAPELLTSIEMAGHHAPTSEAHDG